MRVARYSCRSLLDGTAGAAEYACLRATHRWSAIAVALALKPAKAGVPENPPARECPLVGCQPSSTSDARLPGSGIEGSMAWLGGKASLLIAGQTSASH